MQSPATIASKLIAVATAAITGGAIATSALGMPTASATPQDDLWTLINDQHVGAGCAQYGGSPALMDTAVDIAKDLANNGRRIVPPTDQMLGNRGYWPSSLGEMDYFDPDTAVDLPRPLQFWLNSPTRDLFPNCGMQQLATAVWIVGNKYAAVAVMGTPGPAPADQPSHIG